MKPKRLPYRKGLTAKELNLVLSYKSDSELPKRLIRIRNHIAEIVCNMLFGGYKVEKIQQLIHRDHYSEN